MWLLFFDSKFNIRLHYTTPPYTFKFVTLFFMFHFRYIVVSLWLPVILIVVNVLSVMLYSKSVPFLQPISSHIRKIVCLSITKCYLLFLYYLMIYTRIVSNRITRKWPWSINYWSWIIFHSIWSNLNHDFYLQIVFHYHPLVLHNGFQSWKMSFYRFG